MCNFDKLYNSSTLQFMTYLFVSIIRILLSTLGYWTKQSTENIKQLQQKVKEQAAVLDDLGSEKSILELKQSKFKLAIDNLLTRSGRHRSSIGGLNNSTQQLVWANQRHESEIKKIKAELKRLDRDLIRSHLKLNMLNL